MTTQAPVTALTLAFALISLVQSNLSAASAETTLNRTFTTTVRPFVETYCVTCHGREKPEGELDLSPFTSTASVVSGFAQWELVQERLDAAEMPPSKAKKHPTTAQTREVIGWIQALRKHEADKNAGDPGPVLARRLSNAEYDYSIRDLTGVDLRPTKEFPVDPANQAGFDNSGESLAMSPALLKKYLQAARTVAEHLILKPDGFSFAPHPVVADTDRDKYSVLQIVDFYRRQPTDYADYFAAAWRFRHRAALGASQASLAETAAAAKISARYLTTVWTVLTENHETVGPLAKLQAMWRELPPPAAGGEQAARHACEEMRDFVVHLRAKIIPEVKNLSGAGIQSGSQTLVMWKNRQMAANRRRFDPAALQEEKPPDVTSADGTTSRLVTPAKTRPAATPDARRSGGKFLPPALTTTGSSATFQMAAGKNRQADPDLTVPADPADRARHEAAFARFADVFPDAFYITERARVYLDAEKEKDNAGRLLSAGLHSMTGFFRDDGPLYELVLDEKGRREIDRLWREFDFAASVPQRMHLSFVWFERTDSSYMRDTEFDPYRPENKSVTDQDKVRSLAQLYLDKATRNGASELVQQAISEHFEIVAKNIRQVEQDRIAAEPSHLKSLLAFAARAYRRPLAAGERDALLAAYRAARRENGLDHDEAMRDCVAGILVSPHFCYRIDTIDSSAAPRAPDLAHSPHRPLTDHALASRLSYFLWSSLPDAELLDLAAAGKLREPAVLAAQARRMLRHECARNFAVEFVGHWLDFRRFEEHNAVDRERFPSFDSTLRTAMFEEPVQYFIHLVRQNRPVLDLIYGDYTFVNAPLARHYGMPAPSGGDDEWVRVERADHFGRGGLLPMAVFLTANSPGLRTSPVKRGYWVVRRVLGERIPPPPPTVPSLPNDEKDLGQLTLRETLAKHRADQACAGCHARFDSFGLVFEGYGPVGERRTNDFGGRAVDTRAEFPGGQEFTGVTGLRDYIRANREADFVDNLCRKLLAFGLGRSLLMSDDALVAEMTKKLVANGHRFTTLVETIVTSPQFRLKRAPATLAAAP